MEIGDNFLIDFIEDDLKAGGADHVHTRFPPEPNGCLHIGSAKAIFINWSIAKRFGGKFNLRYDDTNPVKENEDFVRSIEEDITWLIGGAPSGGIFYGSDYFDKCFEFALQLIEQGDAFVCDLSADELRTYRGTLTESGRESPHRNRTVAENRDLFLRMRDGEFPDGSKTLRAKIDMSSSNINMRDPAIYRIVRARHHRQGGKWCVYPLYDYAHPIQDALEGITHSLCSIEFENHRPLYDWVVEKIGFKPAPKQREFARLNVTNTVMSKRYLRQLVETGGVDGWDDPRMPTLAGLRRRGYSPAAIFDFVNRAGIAKAHSLVDIRLLEHCAREELGASAERRIAVYQPIKVTIENYPAGKTEYFELPNHPEKPELGTRKLAFTRDLYIDAADYSDNPPPKFHRLKPGGEVRLMGAYIVKYLRTEGDTIICEADIETANGMPADGRKVKGTIHWLSRGHAADAEIRLYDSLFTLEDVNAIPEDKTFDDYLNPNSLKVYPTAKTEPSLKNVTAGQRFQFVRNGYFCADKNSTEEKAVFNQIVALKDTFKP
ncbi:glutamine--tRNA ligase [Clostridia bacterium]|nr:glutamine--tRNA ligase [Clostridia bacterium]